MGDKKIRISESVTAILSIDSIWCLGGLATIYCSGWQSFGFAGAWDGHAGV